MPPGRKKLRQQRHGLRRRLPQRIPLHPRLLPMTPPLPLRCFLLLVSPQLSRLRRRWRPRAWLGPSRQLPQRRSPLATTISPRLRNTRLRPRCGRPPCLPSPHRSSTAQRRVRTCRTRSRLFLDAHRRATLLRRASTRRSRLSSCTSLSSLSTSSRSTRGCRPASPLRDQSQRPRPTRLRHKHRRTLFPLSLNMPRLQRLCRLAPRQRLVSPTAAAKGTVTKPHAQESLGLPRKARNSAGVGSSEK